MIPKALSDLLDAIITHWSSTRLFSGQGTLEYDFQTRGAYRESQRGEVVWSRSRKSTCGLSRIPVRPEPFKTNGGGFYMSVCPRPLCLRRQNPLSLNGTTLKSCLVKWCSLAPTNSNQPGAAFAWAEGRRDGDCSYHTLYEFVDRLKIKAGPLTLSLSPKTTIIRFHRRFWGRGDHRISRWHW